MMRKDWNFFSSTLKEGKKCRTMPKTYSEEVSLELYRYLVQYHSVVSRHVLNVLKYSLTHSPKIASHSKVRYQKKQTLVRVMHIPGTVGRQVPRNSHAVMSFEHFYAFGRNENYVMTRFSSKKLPR